jgi:hypothetical protein
MKSRPIRSSGRESALIEIANTKRIWKFFLFPFSLLLHPPCVTTEILTLCFAARPGLQGELNILGATDMIIVPQFPIAISCHLVAKLRFQKIEEGLKEIKLSIIDSDGKELQPTPQSQQVPIQIPAGASSASAAIVVGIPSLQIPKPGEYEIGLAVNGRQVMTVPIFVRQLPPQSLPG